ncbi:Pycsar system effector family protein [Streptomyces sp. NPDC094049]|uniref:Pycsar system effector family protein n=1 Tax=Streptomyces sp. NPDC094049 TaxID=3154987 RepID=UPI003320DB15
MTTTTTATAAAVTGRASAELDATLAFTVTDLGRTDTKAGLLLTLDGLLVTALSIAGTDLAGLSLVLAVTGAVALVVAVVLALLVIRPRLSRSHADPSGYITLATATPAAITEILATDHRVTRLQALARIALAKMKLLSLAGDVTLVAVAAVAAALLTR